jgi:hypothetical protein
MPASGLGRTPGSGSRKLTFYSFDFVREFLIRCHVEVHTRSTVDQSASLEKHHAGLFEGALDGGEIVGAGPAPSFFRRRTPAPIHMVEI